MCCCGLVCGTGMVSYRDADHFMRALPNRALVYFHNLSYDAQFLLMSRGNVVKILRAQKRIL